MVKFMILFRTPPDITRFERAYNTFLALIEQMPHVQRRQVSSVNGSPTGSSPYYRVLEVYYQDNKQLEASLRSNQGQLAGAKLGLFPAGSVEMLFADVYEEAGGQTPAVPNTPIPGEAK